MEDNLFGKIKSYLSQSGQDVIPNNIGDIESAESSLGFVFDGDYKEFIENFGGCYVGIAVYGVVNGDALESKSIVDLTNEFKEDGWPIVGNYCVISMDGAGNPIYTNETKKIFIYDHDNGEEEVFFSSFVGMIQEYIG